MNHTFIRNGKIADLKVKIASNKQTGELKIYLGEEIAVVWDSQGTMRVSTATGLVSVGYEVIDTLFQDKSLFEEVLE